MRARIALIVVVVLIVAAVIGRRMFFPGPMAFAGGSTVALADYHGTDPTGVPTALGNADQVKRGEYLARAADCMVCHTAPDGKAFAGGLAFPLPFGTLYSTNITARQGRPELAITAIRIFSTRCSAAFAGTARGFIQPCRSRLTPT